MNKLIVKDSLLITLVVTLVVLMGVMFSDSIAPPIQAALGANEQEIHDSQVMVFFANNISLVILIILGTFISSMFMLKYLGHEE